MSLTIAKKEGEILAPVALSAKSITRLAFGVRYEPQFAIRDRIGSVIDQVLRAPGTPFDPEVFPLTQAEPNGYILHDVDRKNTLQVTYQEAILRLSIDINDVNQLSTIASDYEKFVLNPLKNKAEVKNINRYGLLLFIDNAPERFSKLPSMHYLENDSMEANSLYIRFTRRLQVEEALMRKDVDDFRQVIYSVEQPENGDVVISLDYQHYFLPPLDLADWNSRPFADFANRGLRYLHGEFLNWYAQLLGAEVAS